MRGIPGRQFVHNGRRPCSDAILRQQPERDYRDMEITGEYRIHAAREQVWRALNDADALQRAIPGCESLEKISDTEFRARIVAAIGPVRATFDTRLTLDQLDPPKRYRLSGDSKAGAAGFGKGHADVTLEPAGDGTLLRYAAAFKVGGKLAQVGTRLVEGATRKTADEFFGNLSRELDAGAERQAVPHAARHGRHRVRILVSAAAAAAVLLLLWLLLR